MSQIYGSHYFENKLFFVFFGIFSDSSKKQNNYRKFEKEIALFLIK